MKKYVIVTWPDSQELMNQPWFEECVLINDDQLLESVGSSAYFVPEKYIKTLQTYKNYE